MKVVSIDVTKHFSTVLHDPSPHRFSSDEVPVSERMIPVIYHCDNCGEKISFKTESFEKQCNSDFSNLSPEENEQFDRFIRVKRLKSLSFLDFRCPNCQQSTKILYEGGPSGYWGEFYFKILKTLALKK